MLVCIILLHKQVCRASDDGSGSILDQDIVELEVLLAVSATDVVVGAGALDVEAVDHEDGRSDNVVQFLNMSMRPLFSKIIMEYSQHSHCCCHRRLYQVQPHSFFPPCCLPEARLCILCCFR